MLFFHFLLRMEILFSKKNIELNMNQKSQFLLALALLCVCATALLVQAQSVSVRVLNKAIYDMLNDKTTSRGFTSIHQAYFGDSVMHAPVDKCTTFTSWPSASEVGSDPTFAQILTRKYIVFGTNSVNNSPKRYNYVGVGPNYGSCTGFEAGTWNDDFKRVVNFPIFVNV